MRKITIGESYGLTALAFASAIVLGSEFSDSHGQNQRPVENTNNAISTSVCDISQDHPRIVGYTPLSTAVEKVKASFPEFFTGASMDEIKIAMEKLTPDKLVIDRENNIISAQWLNENNRFHNENNPAHIQYDFSTNTLKVSWMDNGKLHREDGPAYIKITPDTLILLWWQNDMLHNENGASYVKYDFNKQTLVQQWHLNDRRGRPDDGPTHVETDLRTNVAFLEEWETQNQSATRLSHRTDGLHIRKTDPDTQIITYESYQYHNMNKDDPYHVIHNIERDRLTGELTRDVWTIDGQEIPSPKNPQDLVKAYGAEICHNTNWVGMNYHMR